MPRDDVGRWTTWPKCFWEFESSGDHRQQRESTSNERTVSESGKVGGGKETCRIFERQTGVLASLFQKTRAQPGSSSDRVRRDSGCLYDGGTENECTGGGDRLYDTKTGSPNSGASTADTGGYAHFGTIAGHNANTASGNTLSTNFTIAVPTRTGHPQQES